MKLRRSRLLDQDPRVSGLHAQRQCQRWRGWPTLYWHKGTCDLGIFKQLHDYKGGRRVDTSTACKRYRLSPCGGDWPQPACNPGADNEAAHVANASAGHSVALPVPGAPTSAIVGASPVAKWMEHTRSWLARGSLMRSFEAPCGLYILHRPRWPTAVCSSFTSV